MLFTFHVVPVYIRDSEMALHIYGWPRNFHPTELKRNGDFYTHMFSATQAGGTGCLLATGESQDQYGWPCGSRLSSGSWSHCSILWMSLCRFAFAPPSLWYSFI